MNPSLDLAVRYAQRGIPAFPIAISYDARKGSTNKRPLTPRGHHDATADPSELRHLFAHPLAYTDDEVLAVGLLPGPAGYFVVDVDIKGSVDGDDTLAALEAAHGTLPDTVCITTPSGGKHVWLAKGADHVGNAHSLGPGIDVRGDAGWVVAPGTETPWGSWLPDDVTGDLLDGDTPAAAPSWLLARLRTTTPGTTPSAPWSSLDRTALDPRDRAALEALESLGGHGAYQGPDSVLITRPAKTAGISASIGYVGPGLVKVFSSSWPPLDPSRIYDADQLHQLEANDAPSGLLLPDQFWEARTDLARIRQIAHARRVSADALLHCVLARVVALSPHQLCLPPIVGSDVSLCYYAIVLGPSGSGKSSANALAAELFPVPPGMPVADQVPPGSGEGLVEILFGDVEELDDKGKKRVVRKQVRHNAYVYVDEGGMLLAIGSRSGSTTLPMIRSLWNGGSAGTANATAERRRQLSSGSYVFGVVLGFQDHLAGILLDDVDAGTPQRFVWAYGLDPRLPETAPPEPPPRHWVPPGPQALASIQRARDGRYEMPIPEAIRSEISKHHLARARGELRPNPLDSHRMLVREKVAAALALLDSRVVIEVSDWSLAGTMLDISDNVRRHAADTSRRRRAATEEETKQKLASRAVASNAAVQRSRTLDAARKIAEKVWADPGQWTAGTLRRDMRRYRAEFSDALEEAVSCGWIAQPQGEIARGKKSIELRPGANRPR